MMSRENDSRKRVPKFTGDKRDWRAWKQRMYAYLHWIDDAMQVILGKLVTDEHAGENQDVKVAVDGGAVVADSTRYLKASGKIWAAIVEHVSDRVLKLFENMALKNDGKCAWETMIEHFEEKVPVNVNAARIALHKCKQNESESMLDFTYRIDSLANDHDDLLDPEDPEDMKEKITDRTKLAVLLTGLHVSHTGMVDLLSTKRMLTYPQACRILKDRESILGVRDAPPPEAKVGGDQLEAYKLELARKGYAVVKFSKKNKKNVGGTLKGSKLVCYRCGIKGHMKAQCRVNLSKLKCHKCKKRGHGEGICKNDRKQSEVVSDDEDQANVLELEANSSETKIADSRGFVVDSGATHHYSNNKDGMVNFRVETKSLSQAGKNSTLRVEGIGNTDMLTNVNYVPNLRRNLASVAQLVDQYDCRVTFGKDRVDCIARDGRVVLSGIRRGNLYYFAVKNPKRQEHITNLIKSGAGGSKGLRGPRFVGAGLCNLTDTSAPSLRCVRVPKVPTCPVALVADAKVRNLALLWHCRLGHCSVARLKKALRNGLVRGMKVSPAQIAKFSREFCEICVESKSTNRRIVRKGGGRARKLLERVHTDICGPIILSDRGMRYVITFVDDASRFCWVYFIRRKSQAIDAFVKFYDDSSMLLSRHVQHLTMANVSTKCLRSDQGGEYTSRDFRDLCRRLGVRHEWTAPYTPQSNGVAERMNRSLFEMCRAMLMSSGLPANLWTYAIACSVHVLNRTPRSSNPNSKTPYEMMFRRKPNLKYLRVFGCKVWAQVRDRKGKLGKLSVRSEQGRFLGYEPGMKGYRVLIGKKVKLTRNVYFDETEVAILKSRNVHHDVKKLKLASPLQMREIHTKHDEHHAPNPEAPSMNDDVIMNANPDRAEHDDVKHDVIDVPVDDDENAQDNDDDRVHNDGDDDDNDDDDSDNDVGQEQKVYPSRDRKMPTFFSPSPYGDLMSHALQAFSVIEKEPQRYEEACNDPKWIEAMRYELGKLDELKTFDLVKVPPHTQPIKCKWVFKLKRDGLGKVIQYRARLVAKGFSQVKGRDYWEVFAPTCRYDTIRTLFAVSRTLGLRVTLFDVKSAYLYAKLSVPIYMDTPPGHPQHHLKNYCVKLNKTLYGLKQSGREFSIVLHKWLIKNGFVNAYADPCVYTFKNEVIVAIFVDDILAACRTNGQVTQIEKILKAKFKVHNRGLCDQILGMRVRQMANGTIIDQTRYIDDMVKKFSDGKLRSASTPLDNSKPLMKRTVDEPVTQHDYRALIGSLMYAAIGTRGDIAHSVSMLSRYLNDPSDAHYAQAMHVLRYLNTTRLQGIIYSGRADHVKLVTYVDASYATCRDTFRSTTGYVILIAGGAVCWKSRLQTNIAQSSTEAEYMAYRDVAQHVLWETNLLHEMNVELPKPYDVLTDSASAMKIVENRMFHNRTKHIAVRYHMVRDLVLKQILRFTKVKRVKNVGDMLTKSNSAPELRKLARIFFGSSLKH